MVSLTVIREGLCPIFFEDQELACIYNGKCKYFQCHAQQISEEFEGHSVVCLILALTLTVCKLEDY